MSTHPNSDAPDQDQVEQPSDGPAREPGAGGDAGSTSQDQPEPESEAASSTASAGERSDRPDLDAEPPADSNERADDRATVLEPSDLNEDG